MVNERGPIFVGESMGTYGGAGGGSGSGEMSPPYVLSKKPSTNMISKIS